MLGAASLDSSMHCTFVSMKGVVLLAPLLLTVVGVLGTRSIHELCSAGSCIVEVLKQRLIAHIALLHSSACCHCMCPREQCSPGMLHCARSVFPVSTGSTPPAQRVSGTGESHVQGTNPAVK